jgi:hypothetical protein
MTTYFVDSTRPNDTGNGLTLGTAKKTIQAALNFAPVGGDIVELYNGPFRETGDFFNGGSVGNPLIFRGASGTSPVITGADNMTGFVAGGSNIWDKTSVTTQPFVVVIGANPPENMKASRAACTTVGDWFWAANTLSVFSVADPNGSVEVGQRAYCLDGQADGNYITFQDITLKMANDNYVGPNSGCLNLHANPTAGNTLTRVTITQSGGAGIYANGNFSNFTMTDCDITFCGYAGLVGLTYTGNTNINITDCDISDNGWHTGPTDGFQGGITWGADSGEISNCTFHRNGNGTSGASEHACYFASATQTATFRIHHCTATGQQRGGGFKFRQSGTIDHCVTSSNLYGIVVSPTGAGNWTYLLHHNQYDNMTGSGQGLYELGDPFSATGIISLTVYNETMYNGGADVPVFITDNLDVLNIKNCIIHAPAGRPVIAMPTQTGTVAIDYNQWWRTDGTVTLQVAGVGKTFAQWQALGYDANGAAADPLFVDAAGGDFDLAVGSVAINTGTPIGGITDGFNGSAPDRGAFESPAVSAALTGTATANITEADIVTGGKTIILTLTNDNWVAAGATFDAQRQNIINGLTSAGIEGAGWNAQVKAALAVGAVVRTSATVVTITLSARPLYNITQSETITATIPQSAILGIDAIVASPTFTVSFTDTPPIPGQSPANWLDVSFVGRMSITSGALDRMKVTLGGE